MVAYPAFMESLQKFHSLLQKTALQDEPLSNVSRKIDRQFKTYLAELTRKISANANLDNSTFDQSFLVTKAAIFPEVIHLLPKLKRLEKTFEDLKLGSETTLAELVAQGESSIDDYSIEIRKWIEDGQIQISGPNPKAVEAMIGIYNRQIINIRRYKEEILETLMRYFQKEILLQPSVNIITVTFAEDHPLRQKIEDKIKHVAESQRPKIVDEAASKKFLKSKTEQKTNGSVGGITKGERNYRKFETWVLQTNFPVSEYENSSNLQFCTALQSRGFKISDKTAGDYKKRFLSELQASK